MKKLLYLSFLFIPFAGISQQKIWLGPEFGMSVIQVERTDAGRLFQPGYFGGAAFEYRFDNGWFGIKTGLNYAQKRSSQITNDTVPVTIPGFDLQSLGLEIDTYIKNDSKYSQHYLEIPVYAKFNWKEYYIAVGGFVGYQVSANNRTLETQRTPALETIDIAALLDQFGLGQFAALLPPPYEETFDESRSRSGLTNFDWGAKALIGYQSESFGFSAGYQYGIPDFRLDPTGDRDNHHYMQFSINYLFGLGKGKSSSSSL